jgi:hypothetical protein
MNYSENLSSTNLMEKVITFDGTRALRRDCRFIKGSYYRKGTQCFLIEDKWFRINSGYIVYDNEEMSWVLKSSKNLVFGIIGFDESEKAVLGYFTSTNKNERFWYEGIVHPVLNNKIFEDIWERLKEGMTGCYYFAKDSTIPREFTLKVKPHKEAIYSYPFNYNSDPLIPQFLESFLKLFRGEKLVSDAWKYLGDYTYGIEFETERGFIPEKYLERYGLIPCRDGSITGFEYATVPLKGELGIQAIKAQCTLLANFCACSYNESMHIHIGGYPRTKRCIAALFRLGQLLEKEVYSMFPYYYANTAKFKKKSYCGPLPKMGIGNTTGTSIFAELFYWLTNGIRCGTKLPIGSHPMDLRNDHKWDVSPRYVWLNTIPLIWGGRDTIEFRCHTPTLNSQKVINWLFITVAILKYAKKHATELVTVPLDQLSHTKINLGTIINEAYPSYISTILDKYIDNRKDHFDAKNDEVGEKEIVSEGTSKDIFHLTPFV